MQLKFKFYILIALSTAIFRMTVNAAEKTDTLFVTGKITETGKNVPFQGARIQIENFSSAITNENGEYRIRIPFSTALLNVSAIGYANRTVPLQGFSIRNITLYKDAFSSPKNEAGAYQKTEAITVDDELLTRFSGDIRGIRRSGLEGIGANLFIRGYNTLNVTAKPLVIVDGVIWDDLTDVASVHNGYFINPLLCLDVNNIESIEVVKDANSLYGSKGANGVILIKTVRGRSEATKITFDASMSVSEQPEQLPVMNAFQYRTYVTDVLKNAGYSQSKINSLTFLQDDPTSLTYNKYHNDMNWGNQVYEQGISNRYGVNVTGGDEIALYGFSVSYTNVNGVMKGTNMGRLNTLFNSDIKLSSKLNVATSILLTQIDRELRDDGMSARTAPGYISLIKSPLFNPYKFTTSTGVLTDKLESVDDLGVSNPLSILENGIGMHKNYRFAINIKPEWEFNKNMKLSSQTGYSINKMKEHYFIPVNGVSSVVIENRGTSLNMVKDQVMQQVSVYNDTRLSYDKIFGKSHKINAFGGFRYINNRYISDYGEGHNTGGDYVTNLLASLAFKKIAGLNDNWISRSAYAHATYNYNQLYTVWATATMDNSSRFGSEANGINLLGKVWAVFPSVGAEWLVSGEKFMKTLTFIDQLKIHASYGLTGNDNLGNNDRFAYLQSVNYIDKAVGLQLANLNNPELQWETTRKLDGGVDISLFNDVINIGAGIYKFNTSNLLTLKRNSVASGMGSYWTNEGEIQNTGYEVSLGVKLLNMKLVKWNLTATAAHYNNKITALPDGSYTTSVYNAEVLTSVGQPAGVFFGYNALGVISSTEQAAELSLEKQNTNGTLSQFQAGDMIFEDVDNNGIINEKDKKIIGNPNSDFTGSVFNSLTVGNFNLDFVFTYSVGNDIYNYQRSQLEKMSNFYNQSTAVLARWMANGQQTDIPAAVYGDPMGNARFSNRWIEDGSYLKLQNLKLSYKLPLKSKIFEDITFWTSASNLLTFSKYLGCDPETSASELVLYQGIDTGLLPASRTYNFGIKVNL